MKTAIYIVDGMTQFVLTPETEFEQNIVNQLADDDATVAVRQGSFYYCQGGWYRHGGVSADDQSLIITAKRP